MSPRTARHRIPTLLLHKPSGQARVRIEGKDVYLGRYGSPEAAYRYSELLRQHFQSPVVLPENHEKPRESITISELSLRFVTERLPKYVTSAGKPSAEQDCFRGVIRILRRLFGVRSMAEFGPLKLRIVRQAMIDAGWSRNYINKQIHRLRFLFRWGVSWELVPEKIPVSLDSVQSLGPGESDAPETEPRKAVPDEHRLLVRERFRPIHRDIFDLLCLTGARPGEITDLAAEDIIQEGEVWSARLKKHKTARRGKSRTLYFNKTAQAILKPYLAATPVGQLFGIRRDGLSKAVKRVCLKAGVPPFVPHQLRHTVATVVADELDTETAQRLLGQCTKAMAEHYSRAAEKKARAAAVHLDSVINPAGNST